jgi:beta-lactamase class A
LIQGLRTPLRCVLHPWLPSSGRSAAVLREKSCAENKKLAVCFAEQLGFFHDRLGRARMNQTMKPLFVTYSLVFCYLTLACSRPLFLQEKMVDAKKTAEAAQGQAGKNQELQNQLEQIASAAKGRVGVSAMVLETGESVSLNPQDHFPMQSVYKLPIGMAVMSQVDAGKINLDQKVRVNKADFIGRASHSPIRDKYPNGVELSVTELIGWMLLQSDGTASDVLMKLAGGPQAIQAYLTELGIKDMIVLDTEKAFAQDSSLQFRNWATPDAAVSLLRALSERRGLSEPSQSMLLTLMTESTPGLKRLKGLLPTGTAVAHKTGTSGTQNGITAATNDIGLISLANDRHLAIAVFVAGSPADEATREGVIAKIARAVWETVGRTR